MTFRDRLAKVGNNVPKLGGLRRCKAAFPPLLMLSLFLVVLAFLGAMMDRKFSNAAYILASTIMFCFLLQSNAKLQQEHTSIMDDVRKLRDKDCADYDDGHEIRTPSKPAVVSRDDEEIF